MKIKVYIMNNISNKNFIRLLRIRDFIKILAYKCGAKIYYPEYLKHKSKQGYIYSNLSQSKGIKWGEAFCDYYSQGYTYFVDLMWTEDPKPGNYGDWLSPYVVSEIGKVNIKHVNGIHNCTKKHLIALGSVIDCANKYSVIIGAGVSDMNPKIDIEAKFLSVRGPYTRRVIEKLGGECPNNYGDIGFLLSRLYTSKVSEIKSKYLLVRHTRQVNIPLALTSDFREISIFCAKKTDIENFIDELHSAEIVVTSAMHCFITCISYGIPTILITLGGKDYAAPGDGVKYLDALSGVNLPEVSPIIIDMPDQFVEIVKDSIPYNHKVDENVLDNMENTINDAVLLVKYKLTI
ncbi:MAG: hypothetical protein ACI9OE_002345 [Mariniflexile sp.]|jgi:hypothetical protein